MTRALRIALLTYSTRPRGGVVHTLGLAEALAQRGHHVDVWTLGRGGDGGFFREVDPRVTVRLVPFPDLAGEDVGARILRSIRVLGAAFDPAGYDVVHAQDCITANAVPGCIRTIHHLDTFTTPELAACHERAIVEPSGHICVSRSVAEQVSSGWGIEATVIPNGIDASRFAAAALSWERLAWRGRLGRYVLAVGGIEPRKGTADLVEAMAQVQAVDPGLGLVIAGGETLFDYRDYRTSVFAHIEELGVRVELLGTVADDELPAVVAAASVFAFPSVKEGFGLAAVEALAASVPVVMRDLPVLHEVFGHTADFASTPAEFAAALLGASRLTDERRAAAGRELARSYTWAEAALGHETFYSAYLLPAAARQRVTAPSASW